MKSGSLTELQLEVMNALWQLGEGSVADVLAVINAGPRTLAPTTVATLLRRLSKQGWVAHRRHGRQLLYRASVAQADAARSALGRLVATFFGGKPSNLTAQLLQSEDITLEELAEMRRMLAERKK